MNVLSGKPVHWDPYDPAYFANPYPTFARLCEEAPLYYNAQYNFYAASRYEDVQRGLFEREIFISGRGGVLEYIQQNVPIPRGMFIMEDPPHHTIHRNLLNRVFTPRKMAALEDQIRTFCANALDPVVEAGEFDFIANLGAEMPMRVIGMLLGIPEQDLQEVRQRADAALTTEAGKPMDLSNRPSFIGEGFAEYVDWRIAHPSDDLMTELLRAEFIDENGEARRLTRDEIVIFCNILAGAGNETTNRLIGWTGKLLAEHPDQRRAIHDNRALIPQTIEEVLRFEPPGPSIARYVARDTEIQGQKVPEGSAVCFLVAAANRDPRKFDNPHRFDIHRTRGTPHLTFGYGIHACLGMPLARIEGRIALDEILNRFRDWDVDLDNAHLSSTSTVRGWESLPAYTPKAGGTRRTPRAQEPAQAAPPPGAESWKVTMKPPVGGPQEMTTYIVRDGNTFTGRIDSPMGSEAIAGGKISGDKLTWTMQVKKPMPIKVEFEVTLAGDTMSGKAKLGIFGKAEITGQRI